MERPAYCACLSDARVRSHLWRYGNPGMMECSWRALLKTLETGEGQPVSAEEFSAHLHLLEPLPVEDVLKTVRKYVGPVPRGHGWERFLALLPAQPQQEQLAKGA